MIFKEHIFKGVYVIEMELYKDDRGFFARGFCKKEFEKQGLQTCIAQCNVSFNKKKGTLRGMHYQADPFGEAKLVRCISGAIYDVVIDLRCDSSTYKKWSAIELSSKNRKILYIPKGFAHGFQTLEDDTEVFYQMSQFYQHEFQRGVRWDDPVFRIIWPLSDPIISKKDLKYEDYEL